MSRQRDQIIESLQSYYVGCLNKHKMNIELYLVHPAGFGGHEDIMEKITEEIKMMAEYETLILTVKTYFDV